MIRLDGTYAISVDSNSYTLGIPKMTTVVNKKTGEESTKEIIAEPKYYTTLDQALIGYWKILRKNKLTNFEGSIQEALEVVKKQDEKILKLLSKIKEEFGK